MCVTKEMVTFINFLAAKDMAGRSNYGLHQFYNLKGKKTFVFLLCMKEKQNRKISGLPLP